MAGKLYIVATPIGNLEDVTLRAIKVLSEVDIILAEDTRVTQKLLTAISDAGSRLSEVRKTDQKTVANDKIQSTKNQLSTKAKLLSYHQHSGDIKKLEILRYIMDGYDIALVTDAGTPGISDPGNELIEFLVSNNPNLEVVPIPGPSAVTTALSVSGFDTSRYTFLGFWPKKKVTKLLKYLDKLDGLIVFYESPFRILKTLKVLEDHFGEDKEVFVARELTKLHETHYRGTIAEVTKKLSDGAIKGEIVVVLKLY